MNRLVTYSAMAMMIMASFATLAGATSFVPYHNVHNAMCNTGIQTVYVGHSISCPTNYNVMLADLSQPNAYGVVYAALNVYHNGQLVDTLVMAPGQTAVIKGHGAPLRIYVQQTFAGLYAYQKWAKMSLSRP